MKTISFLALSSLAYFTGCATAVIPELPGDRSGTPIPDEKADDVAPESPCADRIGSLVVSGDFTGSHDATGAKIVSKAGEVDAVANQRNDQFHIETRYTSDQSWGYFDIELTGNGDANSCRFCTFITLEEGTFLMGTKGGARDVDVDFETRLAGSLENVVFREVVSVAPGQAEVVEGGCELTLETVTFDQETLPDAVE